MPDSKKPKKLIQAGFILKPHGLKGEVKVAFQYPLLADKSPKTIYLGEAPLPYFVESLQPFGVKNFILKMQDCSDRNNAEELSGKQIFVTENDFEKYFEADEAADLIGYKAFDDNNLLGTVDDVLKFPHQHLAQVMVNGKEVLIPLNDETVVRVEKKSKKLFLKLPEGLLEL